MKTYTHPTRNNEWIWNYCYDIIKRGFAPVAVWQNIFPRRRLLARRRQGGLALLEILLVLPQSLQGKAAAGPVNPRSQCCQTLVSSL